MRAAIELDVVIFHWMCGKCQRWWSHKYSEVLFCVSKFYAQCIMAGRGKAKIANSVVNRGRSRKNTNSSPSDTNDSATNKKPTDKPAAKRGRKPRKNVNLSPENFDLDTSHSATITKTPEHTNFDDNLSSDSLFGIEYCSKAATENTKGIFDILIKISNK